jgi:hypothetical protein
VSDGVWCAQSVQLAQGPVGAGDGPGHGDLPVHRLVEVDGDRRARGVEAGRPVRELVGLHEEQLGPGAAAIHDAGDDLAGHRRTVVLMRHRHLHPFVGGAGLERSEPVGLPELSPCQPLLRPTSPKPFSMSRIVMRPPRLGSRHDGKRRSTHRRHRLTSSRAGDARGLRVVETPSWGRRRDHCERTDKERCVANVSSFATPRSAIERRSPASPSREGMLQRLLRCVRSVASAFIRTSFTCHRPNAPRSRHPRGVHRPVRGTICGLRETDGRRAAPRPRGVADLLRGKSLNTQVRRISGPAVTATRSSGVKATTPPSPHGDCNSPSERRADAPSSSAVRWHRGGFWPSALVRFLAGASAA